MAPKIAPTAPPTMPHTNGLKKRIFTPKMAGSVMPSAAEAEEGMAITFVLLFAAFRPTAKQAPNCAKLAAEAIGIHVFSPVEANIPASMTLYIWCRPITTVAG